MEIYKDSSAYDREMIGHFCVDRAKGYEGMLDELKNPENEELALAKILIAKIKMPKEEIERLLAHDFGKWEYLIITFLNRDAKEATWGLCGLGGFEILLPRHIPAIPHRRVKRQEFLVALRKVHEDFDYSSRTYALSRIYKNPGAIIPLYSRLTRREKSMNSSINEAKTNTTNISDTIYYGVTYGPANEQGYRKIEAGPTPIVASTPQQARDKYLAENHELLTAVLDGSKEVAIFAVDAHRVS